MGLKQAIEDHSLVFFLGTLATGFVSGWGAYGAVQLASGMTAISSERVKQLEGADAVQKKNLLGEIQELESERASLEQQIRQNRPVGGNYVKNIVLSPASPASLKVRQKVEVKFEYVLEPGEEAQIAFVPDGSATTNLWTADDERRHKGFGTVKSFFYSTSPGKVTSIAFSIDTENGGTLYSMTLPVDYEYK